MMRRRIATGIILTLLWALLPFWAFAQTPTVSAQPDRDNIKLGEQIHVKLQVDLPPTMAKAHVSFPPLADTLVDKIDIVKLSKVDTLDQSNNHILLSQIVTVTGFDSGYYAIPPLTFLVDSTPYKAKAFLISVHTVKIDSTKGIRDIRDIQSVSLNLMDYIKAYWPYAAGIVGVILALYAALYFFKKWKRKPGKDSVPKPAPVPLLPADLEAIQKLNELKEKKLWEQGKFKEYYTELTDIIRRFISRRYGINAMELTSRELIYALRRVDLETSTKEPIRQVFILADLVKFAKETPVASENEHSWKVSLKFVELNREPEVPEEDEEESNNNSNQER